MKTVIVHYYKYYIDICYSQHVALCKKKENTYRNNSTEFYTYFDSRSSVKMERDF